MIPGIEITYLDTQNVKIEVAGVMITPSYQLCGLYRLPSRRPQSV